MRLPLPVGLLLVLMPTVLARASAPQELQVICLTTLEWPPYVSARLPDQGASAHVLRQALARSGVRLHLSFYPWRRAVALARGTNSGVHGYFPEYRSAEVSEHFELSPAIGHGPLGLAIRVGSDLQWHDDDDLLQYRLGVVSGYVNTASLDANIAAGRQRVLGAIDDATNLRRLAIDRIDAAVIDPNVFAYLVANEAGLARFAGRLSMHPRLLEEKSLHVAFAHTPAGAAAARITEDALRGFDVAATQAAYLGKGHRPAPIPVGDAPSEVPCRMDESP